MSDMNYVESFDLFGSHVKQIPCLTGEGIPNSSTIGAVGMLYMDTSSDNKDLYKCVSAENGKYAWIPLQNSGSLKTDETLNLVNGVISVNTTNDMEKDNTLPITSAGVFAAVGNIEELLKTI